MIYVLVFTNLLLFAVICSLLRQLNLERVERKDMMDRYRELATRVRLVHLSYEGNPQEQHTIMPDVNFAESTVSDLDGVDHPIEWDNLR